MIPTVGRIVHYTLTENDAAAIKKARADAGYVAQHGNAPHEGDVLPMLIVRPSGSPDGSSVNGQVFLDGNDTFWATSLTEGEGPGHWSVPPRVKAEA
jgi:hypothetical protein